MKKLFIAIFCLLPPLFAGCGGWLDVRPLTEVREVDIYVDESGFKEVMNGAYITAASKSLYGLYATMYFNDLLAQLWYVESDTGSREESVSNWDYTESRVETLILAIWEKYYSAISIVNNLLENLEKTEVRFTAGNKELLTGEAYGLRAFLHFDLLRMFGPVPAGATDDMTAIPYVTEFTIDPDRLTSRSYGEVKRMILEDLDLAEKYLKDDPLTKGSMYDLNHPNGSGAEYVPQDEWHYYRQTHFNIYAVEALRARFRLWTGDAGKAAEAAWNVINAANADGSRKFDLATEANTYNDANERNLVMRCEHIFALHSSRHQSILNGYTTGADPRLVSQSSHVGDIFESSLNPSDSRNAANRYWHTGTQDNMLFRKYSGSGLIPAINMVPLIRLSEMYLILIETLPLSEAEPLFNTYRQAKSMSTAMDISTESKRAAQTQKEYRKEFFGEGQMFYYYKRHNTASITVPVRFTPPAGGYVIPKPDSQLLFE